MGVFAGLLGNAEQRLNLKDPALAKWFSGDADTAAGVTIDEESALTFSAVFRAVDLISKHLAMLPLRLYERTGERTKRPAADHPLYLRLYREPNPEMSAYNWRSVVMEHVLLWGNHFSEIEWSNGGEVLALWPLMPDRMRVTRAGGRLRYFYRVQPGEPEIPLPAERVLHVRGMSKNGLVGKSVVAYAREDVGLGMVARDFGARFFGNGASAGDILRHPGVLGDEAYERLRENWETRHRGTANAHRVAILEEGMEYQHVGIPPEDAQFLQTRKFQVTEVARWFGVPPHKLMDLERSTFSNIEHQAIEYVQDSLQPWATNLEQSIDMQLLTPRERERYYSKFTFDALLRGDSQARHAAYSSGIQNGYYSVNDVREMEDRDPVDGGDENLVQLNLMPLGMLPAAVTQQAGSEPDAGSRQLRDGRPVREERARRSGQQRHRLQLTHLGIYEDVIGRILRREANDVGNAARRLAQQRPGFEQWLTEFYEEHQEFSVRQLEPAAQAYARLVADVAAGEVDGVADDDRLQRFVGAYLWTWAARHAAIQADRVRSKLEEPDPLAAIEAEMELWRGEDRAASIAKEETVRANNAVAILAYSLAGVRYKTWLSFGDNCPYCTELNGRTIGISFDYLDAGQAFAPNGAAPLVPSYRVGHPPAHRGCDCMVVAG